jgi:hypothetical protein
MTSDREARLDALLRDVGRHARDAAPPFERTWRSAQARAAERRSMRSFSPIAGAAALAAAVAVGLVLLGAPSERELDLQIASWHSPTAVLLATPAREWPAAPRIGESAIRLDMRLDNAMEPK